MPHKAEGAAVDGDGRPLLHSANAQLLDRHPGPHLRRHEVWHRRADHQVASWRVKCPGRRGPFLIEELLGGTEYDPIVGIVDAEIGQNERSEIDILQSRRRDFDVRRLHSGFVHGDLVHEVDLEGHAAAAGDDDFPGIDMVSRMPGSVVLIGRRPEQLTPDDYLGTLRRLGWKPSIRQLNPPG